MNESEQRATIIDCLTGEERPLTSYEDVRQDLLRFVLDQMKYPKNSLQAHFLYSYKSKGEKFSREIDLLIRGLDEGTNENLNLMLVLFAPGQLATYKREVKSLARLMGYPLAAVIDMDELILFSASSGEVLIDSMDKFPSFEKLQELAMKYPISPLSDKGFDLETRILHGYTGLLKGCSNSSCVFSGDK